MEQDLINKIKFTSRANDYSGHNGSPDKVRFHKDKEQHQQNQRRKKKQKTFSEEDPHVDLQV